MSEPGSPIVIAISAKLLFEPNSRPGPVFSFVKALKVANDKIKEHNPDSEELFKIIVIKEVRSNDDFIYSNISTHGLQDLLTGIVESGEDLIPKLQNHETLLYLSDEGGFKVDEAVKEGIAAAIVANTEDCPQEAKTPLRVVFDGDAVVFSDESERVNATGLPNFLDHERTNVDRPMDPGPLKSFLVALERLKRNLSKNGQSQCPIQTYMLTSRDAGSAGYRALNTLKTWGMEIDKAHFLCGSPKGPLLNLIRPHIFFDDQDKHIEAAVGEGTLACKVP